MFMVLSSWQSHCESSPDSFDECRTAPSGGDARACQKTLAGGGYIGTPKPVTVLFTSLTFWNCNDDSWNVYHTPQIKFLATPLDFGSLYRRTHSHSLSLHPLSPFIITRPEIWYSFYSPTEGRRLSRRSWLVTYRDGLPAHRRSPILVLTGFWRSATAQLRWSRPTRYH